MVRSADTRLERWERRSSGWLIGLAIVFLVVYAAPVLWPSLPPEVDRACVIANMVIWALFVGDFLIRVALAEHRRRFLRSHVFDILVLALPMIRPLRLLRLITVARVFEHRLEVWTRGRLAVYVGTTTALLVCVGALAILEAEREVGNITSYSEALWWAVVTVTTVGYGDFSPVTGTGRLVAAGLMVCGIGLLGFVTGSLASWVLERISAVEKTGAETQTDVSEVLVELRALRAEVAALRATMPASATSGEETT